MNNRQKISFIVVGLAVLGGMTYTALSDSKMNSVKEVPSFTEIERRTGRSDEREVEPEPHPMAIESLREREYPGSEFTIEERLSNGTNYQRFIVSYLSEDDLTIRGLLTVPLAEPPDGGFPAVLFVHGYIPPDVYSTVNSYPTYQATLARSGMVTFKPDLRGHDESEGEPVSAHFSEKYVVDTLYALASLKMHEDVNPERIGYWGHSNGGEIGLRSIVINRTDIKAASFWAGVVGSFEDMLETYNEDIPFLRDRDDALTLENGLPSENPEFWNRLDPYTYLNDIDIPIQLQHGTDDDSVPVELSLELKEALEEKGKSVEYFEYVGDDHNIGQSAGAAWRRSIEFFEEHL